MRSRLGRSILSLALLAACSGEEARPNPPPIATPIDASPVAGAFAALAGTWTGTLLMEKIGPASGVVSLDASGQGSYFVTVAGAKQSGSLQLLSFSGTFLRARAAGQERTLPAALDGDTLRLEVPELGAVVLRRSP